MRFSITSFLKVVILSLLATPFMWAGEPQVKKETAAASAPAAQTQTVNINKADAPDLEKLPGIGPALASRIIAHRDANGPFKSVENLTDVKGIGAKMLEKLRPYLKI